MPPRPPAARGSLRVVAGEARGRRLASPPGTATRPTSDRVRQAVFNALDSLGAVRGATVVDAFGGSGALGIEALSRGADHATFAETDPVARQVIEDNLLAVGLAERATVTAASGPVAIAQGGPWDLVLLDPPYSFDGWDDLLIATAAHLADDGVVVVESDREVAVPAPLVGIRAKGYGGTVVVFATHIGAHR